MLKKWFNKFLDKRSSEPDGRAGTIRLTGLVGIAANVLFALAKLLIGFTANSISIMSDAVNNLTDAVSSVITLVGLKLSMRPPDKKHPLGYGRIEYISGMIVSALVLVTGIEFLKTSAERILEPQKTSFAVVSFVVLGITVLGKWFLSQFQIAAGQKASSEALVASGMDARMDVLASLLTMLAAIVSAVTGWYIDGYIGVLLALFILYTGITLIRETVSHIIGERPDKELADGIKAEVIKFEPITGAYDLILHSYGPATRLGSLNLEVPDYVTVEKVYDAMDKAQQDVYMKFGVYLTFGLYSINTYDKEVTAVRESITQTVLTLPGAVSMHNFHYDKEQNFFRFDVIVDFDTDPMLFRKHATDKVQQDYPGASVQINIDLDYA
ncbi:cation diffusion facilitator family transporter [Novisyntrophococcus fermenticellae]|uniref:cation diffusion facilitator family transporter n=1 Tax=Novisyntrophococcus fermenticellae TaxID=2068655 RepID=UPI001E607C18|nr:cation diffusion facilitator family transporter [Novisyntrophococcus fermenticellae]